MPQEEAAQLVYDALEAAMNGNADTAGNLFARVGVDSDANRMYGVCCGIALAGKQALTKLFGNLTPDLSWGERWHVIHLQPAVDKARTKKGNVLAEKFAIRFLVAYCNEDQAAMRGLYDIALTIGGEHFVRCTSQLLADVAGLCSAAIKHVQAQG